MDRAKIVHVGFRLNPTRVGIRDPEVISIYPHPISEPAGLIRISEETQKELGASGKSQFSMPAWLSLMLRKSFQKKKEYALP